MATTIRLTVLTGPHKGTRYCTRGLDACLVGRAGECPIRFEGETRDLCISRYHCQVLLDGSHVRIQDMDSSNGTYVNGHKIGGKGDADNELPETSSGIAADGDILTIGGTSLQVSLMDCSVDFSRTGTAGEECQKSANVKKDCPVTCQEGDCADR